MSGRRLLRVVGAVAMLTGTVLLVTTAPAAAADVEYGWWSAASAPGGLPVGTVPATPGAPTDGIYVSVGPTIPGVTGPVPDVAGGQVPAAFSPVAVGAVRFPVEATDTAVLTLEITASSSPPSEISGQLTSALLACPISKPDWTPAQNGSYADKPEFECQGIASVGSISSDAKQTTWELGPIFQSPLGSVNVAIVAVAQSPFFVSFAAPGPTSVAIQPGEEPEPSGEEPAADSGGTAYEPGTVADPTLTADLASLPEATDEVTPVDDAAAAVDAPVPQEIVPSRPSLPLQATGQLANALPKGRDGWRVFFGALLVIIGGGLFWTAGMNARAPRLIGPLSAGAVAVPAEAFDDADVRGVGRHVRPRVGSPRRLR